MFSRREALGKEDHYKCYKRAEKVGFDGIPITIIQIIGLITAHGKSGKPGYLDD